MWVSQLQVPVLHTEALHRGGSEDSVPIWAFEGLEGLVGEEKWQYECVTAGSCTKT